MTAQTLASPRLRPLLTTAAYYLAFIGLGMGTAAAGPALPYLARHTASTLDQISFIFVAGSFGYLVGSFFGGRAYDRFQGHRILAIVLFASAILQALVPVLPRLWLLASVLILLGMTQGVLDVGANTLLMWTHGKKVGPFMNGLHFFFGIGSFVAPIIIARAVAITGDVHWAYWLFALFALPMAAWLWRLPSPALQAATDDRPAAKVPLLPVALFVLFFVAYVGAEVGYGNWIYTYSFSQSLADASGAAYLTSAFWGSFTFGRLLGIGISTRLKSQSILYIDLCGCLISLGVILLWPASPLALWIGTCGLGLFMASIFPTGLAFAESQLRLTGTITGWFLVGSGAGGMILPWLIGQLFVRLGPLATMSTIFIDMLANLALMVGLTVLALRKRHQEALS